jgi:hypothetical protein
MITLVSVLTLIQAGLLTKDIVKLIISKSSIYDKSTKDLIKAYNKAFKEVIQISIKDLTFFDDQTKESIKGGDIDAIIHISYYFENSENFSENIFKISGVPNELKGYTNKQLIDMFNNVKDEFEKQIPNTESLALVLKYLISSDQKLKKVDINVKEYFGKVIPELSEIKGLIINKDLGQQASLITLNEKMAEISDTLGNFLPSNNVVQPTNTIISRSEKEKYYELWNKLESSKAFSSEFNNLIKEIYKIECNYLIPSSKIYSKAERILYNIDPFIRELQEAQSQNDKVQNLGILSLILRNSYYNLTGIIHKSKLEQIINEFNKIDYIKLKNRFLSHWLSFAQCLLKDYRYSKNREEFSSLIKKMNKIIPQPNDIYDEIQYEKSIFALIELDFKAFMESLENWVLTEKSSAWSCIKKAMLLNILNSESYKEEIPKLVRMSIDKTDINQEKLWFYEILRFYDISQNISQNPIYNEQIDIFKSKGYYSLDTVVKSLIEKDVKVKIEPQEDRRYTLSYPLGSELKDSVNWEFVKFIELIYKSGLPLMPNIKFPVAFISRNDWWVIFKGIKSEMAKEVLSLSLQYSGNDFDEKYIRAMIQNILFDSNISQSIKKSIFISISNSFLYLLENHKIYYPSMIYIISEIIKCLDYIIWENFFTKLWSFQLDEEKIISKQFYSTIWGINKAINNFLPYIENNNLLNEMLQKFYLIKNKTANDNNELTALKYIGKILFSNDYFELLESHRKAIRDTIISLLQNKELSRFDLIKIYYYDLKLSKDLQKNIMTSLKNLNLSNNLMLNWNLFLELSVNDELINTKIRNYIIENDSIVFGTGISDDCKNRSFGGLQFRLSDTLKENNTKYFLNWSQNNIEQFYIKLKYSLNLLESFTLKEYLFSAFSNDESILQDMYNFLTYSSGVLDKQADYIETLEKVQNLLSSYNINNIRDALLSRNANTIQKSISQLSKNFRDFPDKCNQTEFILLLMKIIRQKEPKLEFAIEALSNIITIYSKNSKWVKTYKQFYLDILSIFNHNINENLDRIVIEYHLIKIAIFLKQTLEFSDPIIDVWIDKKRSSKFLEIKKMKP